MFLFQETKALLKEKSGKRLMAVSLLLFLIITVMVFVAVFRVSQNTQLKMMDELLWEIPKIAESIGKELELYQNAFETGALSKAEVGLSLYEGEETLEGAEKLAWVRDAVSAASVSLVDEQGKVVSTTGITSPEDLFLSRVPTLDQRAPHLELYPAPAGDGTQADAYDGRYYVRLPLTEGAKRGLVFEFPCEEMVEMYRKSRDWSSVFSLLLSGSDYSAYAKDGDELKGYPLEGLTVDETSQLHRDLMKVFADSETRLSRGNENDERLISLVGKHYLAKLMRYEPDAKDPVDLQLVVPLQKILRNSIFIALAIAAIIGFGMLLLQVYIFRRIKRIQTDKPSPGIILRAARPGLLAVLAVTVLFYNMLTQLEGRSILSINTGLNRETIQQVADWNQQQESSLRSAFEKYYRSIAQSAVSYLKLHPEYQTHAGLETLNRLNGSGYVMLFDKNGNEIASSNSYMGFTVEKNLDEAFQAVQLGYPHAFVGPRADPYTGQMQVETAVVMTDEKGQANGFLLAVFPADALNRELKRISYESTINTFTVHEGHITAAVSDATGCFTAHSDPAMIGQKAANYIDEYEPGLSFEGFTDYKGNAMCISAASADGKTLLFMSPESEGFSTDWVSALLLLAILLILILVYYPMTGRLTAQAMEEAEKKAPLQAAGRNTFMLFFTGYGVFLMLFLLFTLIAHSLGWWSTFNYVFSGQWSKGLHLYSIWAALFSISIALTLEGLARFMLDRLENNFGAQTRTVARMAKSFVSYAVGIFLFFFILDKFGADMTAMIASAGVISIAAGMGAQSMAADLLAGVFMALDGSLHVGDYVSLTLATREKVTGYVTDMGIRTLTITDADGNELILNNSKTGTLMNMTKSKALQEAEKKEEHKTPAGGGAKS